MAAPCAYVMPSSGAVCGAKKSAPIHVKALGLKDGHDYEDATTARFGKPSDGRTAYLRSKEHRSAMDLSAGATDCWPAAYGAPGACYGPITASHTLSSGAHGGLKVADTYPVPPACSWHNSAMEQDVEVRAWAEVTYLTHNGKQYPFKPSKEWLQAERERGVAL